MKGHWILLISSFVQFKALAQCDIDKTIITNNSWRTTMHHARYIGNTPSYVFSPGGDTSTKWNVFRKPIDIKQVSDKAAVYRQKVEDSIIQYSGKQFFNDLKFISVEVVYPDQVEHFRQHGRPDILQLYTATYLYTYRLEIDTLAYVDFEFPVNNNGELINKMFIPLKGMYKPIVKKIDYCQLIKIAVGAAKDILPIAEISFEYDIRLKTFNWVITHKHKAAHQKGGKYPLRIVTVNAADLTKAEPGFTTYEVVVDEVRIIPPTMD